MVLHGSCAAVPDSPTGGCCPSAALGLTLLAGNDDRPEPWPAHDKTFRDQLLHRPAGCLVAHAVLRSEFGSTRQLVAARVVIPRLVLASQDLLAQEIRHLAVGCLSRER